MSLPPLALQCFVAGTTYLAAFSVGATITYPSVLLRQLQANDTIVHFDVHTLSWIGSLHGIAGIPSILLPLLMQYRGRKIAFILSCIILITGWTFICLAQGITMLFIGECLQGLGTNSFLAVCPISISEMIQPNYRNTCLLLYGTMQAVGISIGSILGNFLHWRKVGFVTVGPLLIALPISYFWPESPLWLAHKKRFGECRQSFIKLRGTGENSERELKSLLDSNQNEESVRKIRKYYLKQLFQTVKRRDFRIPALHSFVLLSVLYCGGGMPVLIYTSDMMIKCAGKSNDNIKIIMDCIFSIGFYVTTILVSYFSSKRVLLCSMIFSTMFMSSASLVTYLQSTNVLPSDSELAIYSLLGFMVSFSLGSASIGFTLSSEVMPVKHRGIGGGLYILFTCLLHTFSMKTYPYLCIYLHIWGVFLIYAVYKTFLIIFIGLYVPNTKNRTLQEIENFYNKCYLKDDVIDKHVNEPFVNT